jgi:DNA end-binding protein Ku
MRAFWSGELALGGCISIPVKLYTSSKDATPKFHQLHKSCGTPINLVRRCAKCNIDLAWEDIAKGHEVAPNEYAVFTKEELADLEGTENKGLIQVLHTVAPSGISPVFLDATYWVGAASKRANAYITLRDALAGGDLVAIATVQLRTRLRLAMLGAQAGLITLTTLHYSEELVDSKEIVPPDIMVRDRERGLALQLLKTLEDDFRPEDIRDEYVKRLVEAVQEKVEAGETKVDTSEGAGSAPASAGKKPGQVVDLEELLKKGIEAAARRNKGKGKGPSPSRQGHQPSKRAS